MKTKCFYFLLLGCLILFFPCIGYSQIKIEGFVYENDKTPIIGANVYIEGTYDGAITNENGYFEFITSSNDDQNLTISYLGYETKTININIEIYKNTQYKLRESAQSLDAVEISASTFKAGDNSKVAVLNPLDMVTTAGSNGDVIAALQTLPGTQANPEDGRLFVRGGDARETQIFIDGMRVFSPYNSSISIENTPARGRFSPFLFKGVSFSTGGYSAGYGQALSGILDMNTIDEAAENQTNISLMSIGVGIGQTVKWKNQSISINASYINFGLYHSILKPNIDFEKPISGISGELVYRLKTKKGLLKSYFASDYSDNLLNIYDIDIMDKVKVGFENFNYYSDTTYTTILDDKTSLMLGTSFGVNKENGAIDDNNINATLSGIHQKLVFKTVINDHFIMQYGGELIYQKDGFQQSILETGYNYQGEIGRAIPALFIESDYFLSNDLAFKFGSRLEYNAHLKTYEVNSRITVAQKINKSSQVSLAYGNYNQEVDAEYILYEQGNLINEKATHYLFNYNYKSKKQILRLETYYKKYNDLISYQSNNREKTNLSNDGYGYAYGIDLFYRANQVIKNIDFWVSYSWLENERKYLDYPVEAVTRFSTRHNVSLVTKTWFDKLNSQLGLTYSFASGRPYNNPNIDGFLDQRAKPYHNVSASWSYLISPQKILFISASNIFDVQNEFGYRYASTQNEDGIYPGEIIRPSENQFVFIGFFLTISKDKSKNQLNNL